MKSGIYQIKNLVNGKKYYGSSVNMGKRKSRHFSNLNNNKHENQHLQNAWNKYGKDNFVFEPLVFCAEQHLILLEKEFIKSVFPNCYNVGLEPTIPCYGRKLSDEHKKKISQGNTGKVVPMDVRKKIADDHIGMKTSEENKKRT
jgi:group I intron endonuclease